MSLTYPVPKTLSLASAIRLPRSPLPFILALQSIIALVTLHNTAFQDEALYLFAGRQIVHSWFGGPPVVEPYAQYFSGYPSLYPALAGVLDMAGGVEAARFFSLVCILGVTTCVFYLTRHLFDDGSALFATLVFAFQGSVLFIERLATYDAACLLCLALATTIAVRVGDMPQRRALWWSVALGPLLLLAVGMKYAGMLFVPAILLLLVMQTVRTHGWQRAALYLGAAMASLVGMAVLVVLLISPDVLIGLRFTTTNRVAFARTPALALAGVVLTLGGIALALGMVGAFLLRDKRWGLGLALLGTAFLAPAYHIYKGEAISLNKHIAFAVFFVAPLAGFALSRLAGQSRLAPSGTRWPMAVAICLVIFGLGMQQAQTQYHVWGNSASMIMTMRSLVRPNVGHYLAEEYDVARYSLQDVTAPWQWAGVNWFEYTDHAKQHLIGVPAYRAAIAEGYFDVVELNYGFNVNLDLAIDGGLKHGHLYTLVAQVPYVNSYGPGTYWIWAKTTNTAFTSCQLAPVCPAAPAALSASATALIPFSVRSH